MSNFPIQIADTYLRELAAIYAMEMENGPHPYIIVYSIDVHRQDSGKEDVRYKSRWQGEHIAVL